MPKGPEITDEVQRLIAEVYLEDQNRTAKEVAKLVQDKLRQVNPRIKPNWPGQSAVQNKLKQIRGQNLNNGPLGVDETWSIGRLSEYKIPTEAVPKVLAILGIRSEHEPLTIREVCWIGYLHAVFNDPIELAVWATFYADREKISDNAGVSKDTSDIDYSVHSRYILIPFFFEWLFRKVWIPDSYKRQLAQEQCRRYEDELGVTADSPDLSTSGWLLYATSLQQMLLRGEPTKGEPIELLQLAVLASRLNAKDEGRLFSSADKYIDILEIWKTGEFHEKQLDPVTESSLKSGKPATTLMKELLKFHAPGLMEFIRNNSSGLLEAINKKIVIDTENTKKEPA